MRVPALTTDQMREVDRLMIEAYGIALEQMMENAGRDLAELARQMLDGRVAWGITAVAAWSRPAICTTWARK